MLLLCLLQGVTHTHQTRVKLGKDGLVMIERTAAGLVQITPALLVGDVNIGQTIAELLQQVRDLETQVGELSAAGIADGSVTTPRL